MVRSLIPNSTQIPDMILDQWMWALTGAELKVLLYVARRTYGFGKDWDRISLQQLARGIRRRDGSVLDRGTGLSVSSVARAAKSLEARGLLVRQRNLDASTGEHDQTTYRLNLDFTGELGAASVLPDRQVSPEVGERALPERENVLPDTGGGTPMPGEGGLPERERQETDQETEQETAAGAPAEDLVAALVAQDLNREDAVRLAGASPAECRRQLDYLPYKAAELRGSPGAWLRCAIEGAYGPPRSYRQAQASARRQAATAARVEARRAQDAYVAAWQEAYAGYLDQRLGEIMAREPRLWEEFQTHEAQLRAAHERLPLSEPMRARCLAAFDTPGSHGERCTAFFAERGRVLDFWAWDRTVNRQPPSCTSPQLDHDPCS